LNTADPNQSDLPEANPNSPDANPLGDHDYFQPSGKWCPLAILRN